MSLEEFIRTQLESVDDLRALLLLYAAPRQEWDVMSVAGKLYLPPERAAAVLGRLAAKRFLVAEGEPLRYRFQAQAREAEQLIGELSELDRERPVTLINMVYGRPGAVRAFAEAFKIKKKEN
ncbi:MAG TPA: hypothetical protein VMH30_11075 [Verrucomicrobiae bacterium]|nr:hypothetical protein [Verrucomicrobiae bacterium]